MGLVFTAAFAAAQRAAAQSALDVLRGPLHRSGCRLRDPISRCATRICCAAGAPDTRSTPGGGCDSVGSSLVICTVTTAIGFFVFLPSDYRGVAELGLIAGSGMFIILALTLTTLPALLGHWLRLDPARPPTARVHFSGGWLRRLAESQRTGSASAQRIGCLQALGLHLEARG